MVINGRQKLTMSGSRYRVLTTIADQSSERSDFWALGIGGILVFRQVMPNPGESRTANQVN